MNQTAAGRPFPAGYARLMAGLEESPGSAGHDAG
jgi:hypothetical protein